MGRRIIVGLLLLLLLAACGGTGTPGASSGSAGNPVGSPAPEAPAPPSEGEASAGGDSAAGGGDPAGGGTTTDRSDQSVAARNAQGQFARLVIRTGNISLVVDNVDSAEARIRQIAESRGGYVLSSQVNGDDNQRRAAISFRIPTTRFDESIAEVAKMALEVESQDVQGQDVTDEYVDLGSRVRNLQAVEARLLDFLQQAQKIEDALRVNQQLTEIQGQIEEAEGRISYLKESAAYSTINASLRGRPVVVVATDPGWSPGTTARNAANTVLAFAQVIADILIVFAVWFPIWLPLAILGLWFWRRSRRVSAPTAHP